MVTMQKIGNEYYLCKRKKCYAKNIRKENKITPVFKVVSLNKYGTPGINARFMHVCCPRELLGKKIMLKVVVLEDKKEPEPKDFKFEDMGEVYA